MIYNNKISKKEEGKVKKIILQVATILIIAVLLSTILVTGCKVADKAETTTVEATEVETKTADSDVVTGQEAESSESINLSDIKFIYICKKLTDDWFKMEDKGMKEKAEELGIQYNGIDADYKDERNMQAVDNVIAQKVKGVAICATNQGLGPSVSQKFKEANIPFLAIDDTLADKNGDLVPYVGVPTRTAGVETAKALITAAKEKNFFAEGNNWRIMIIEMAQISTCHEMALGYQEEFIKSIDGITDDEIVFVDVKTGSFDDSIAAVTAAFNANPVISHWIFATVDDYPAYATVKMLGENNFNFKNVLISGFGAYQPSNDIWAMGGDIADCYMSMSLDPEKEGQIAIQLLYDKVVNGIDIPMETRIGGSVLNVNTWQQ